LADRKGWIETPASPGREHSTERKEGEPSFEKKKFLQSESRMMSYFLGNITSGADEKALASSKRALKRTPI